jgi:uncharacterized membrane protein YbhN (UPF0104 family)
MAQMHPAPQKNLLVRIAITLVLLAGAVYVLARNWNTVQRSVQVARGASIGWLALAIACMAGTFLIAGAIYGVLALHRLRYSNTVLVEVAAAFINRLLPSGIGGLGLHGIYLYRQKHTGAEATVVVSVNNLLGMVAHVLLLAIVLACNPSLISRFVQGQHHVPWQLAVLIVLLVGGVLAVPVVRQRLVTFGRSMLTSVWRLRPRRVVLALALAALLTATYTLILVCAVHALGLRLSVLQVFIVFSIGMLTATAAPTPGGLVGAEAGLFAGFVAYGVAAAPAGAAVLLYRLASYWLPLVPGLIALLAARKRKLL